MLDSILPADSKEKKQNRSCRDRQCYIEGKDARYRELPRDVDVQYKDDKDRDCFNMGYSYAVRGQDILRERD